MKKLLALLLILLLCFAFTACGEGESTADSATPDTASSALSGSSSSSADNSSSSAVSDGSSSAVSDGSSSAAPDSDSSAVSGNGSSASKSSGSAKVVYDTVQEYIESDEVAQEMNEVKEASGDVFAFDYYVEDDTLVYDYTYQTEYPPEDIESLKESLDNSLETNASKYSGVVEVLKKHVNTGDPKIEIIYRNHDGSVITSRVYE